MPFGEASQSRSAVAVFVSFIPPMVLEALLWSLFSRFGTVVEVRVGICHLWPAPRSRPVLGAARCGERSAAAARVWTFSGRLRPNPRFSTVSDATVVGPSLASGSRAWHPLNPFVRAIGSPVVERSSRLGILVSRVRDPCTLELLCLCDTTDSGWLVCGVP